jgi:hypothetical protein
MARFSGTKNVTPNKDGKTATVSATNGNVYLTTKSDGKVVVNNDVEVGANAKINADADIFGNLTLKTGGSKFKSLGTDNVGHPPADYLIPQDPNQVYDTIAHRQAGSAYFTGGVGIEKDLNVGGFIYGRIAQANTATTSSQVVILANNNSQPYYLLFAQRAPTSGFLYEDTQSPYNSFSNNQSQAESGLVYYPNTGGLRGGELSVDRVSIVATENTTSTDTGVLQVKGGASFSKDITIGGTIYPSNNFTDAYLNDVYSKFLGISASTGTIALGAGMTDLFGEIRVRGNNPIGTAPVVTNVLYVTVDGDDTNDGRAMDPSRACRTIAGAMKSVYYQPGTQIQVSAGRYLEDNPLPMKPYTSVKGSDIRTTFIEPINKTQDLFHMNSGCYLNYMTFLNGRSGLLEGPYTAGVNRGAYATAFPPQTGDNRIDLFHSPYVQNCTNQSGPWLKDGTMFVPNQTVQVPSAVGTGTWLANTTSIVVSVSTGSISIGQSINAGQQNPGFFNARTLLLANKPFIQSQVVAFVDNTFNSGSFTYNQTKCSRDTGLIVNAIAEDMLYNSTSDSTFSGLQYWKQNGYTGQIYSELTATIGAINQLKQLTHNYVSAGNQARVDALFTTITNIISTSTNLVGISDQVIYGGLPTINASIVADYNALQANKAAMQQAVVNYVNSTYPGLNYTTATCYRDVGYIIDSVSFDLLHPGIGNNSNVQSIKSGVYYYNFASTSTLAATNEIPATTAAYNFIKSIIPSIVKSETILSPNQTVVPQYTTSTYGSSYEISTLQNNIDIITRIVRNGPVEAGNKTPINVIENTATSVLNSYNLLIKNIGFIQAEVIAFLNRTMNNFNYNRQLCYRDAGIIVENMSYDLAFGGNQKSVENGLAYYKGVTSVIAGQETQTVSAFDYIAKLAKDIVVNTTCTVLIPPVGIPTASQVRNTALTGGAIAQDSILKLLDITTNIILNGPSSAPDIYTSTGPDAAFVSAEILLQANRTFIQENVLNYINYNLCYPAKSLPYNQIKCRRDARIIIDSIAEDLLHPTPTHSQSTFAGLQYFTQNRYTGLIKDQINPTISAVTYLRDLSVKVVQNITTATDALVGIFRYTNGVQTTASNYATSSEVAIIKSEFATILSILNGKINGVTDLVVPNGPVSTLPSVQNTVNLLLNNSNYMAQEIVAYVTATNPGFTYSTSTCARDVGYIIQSIAFDLLHGGNRQAIQSGLSYYASANPTTVIPNETTATTMAFDFISSLTEFLIVGNPINTLQTLVKPVTGLTTGSISAAQEIRISINTITNIITNGPSVAAAIKPISLTASTSTGTINAYNIIKANKEFIVAETISYLDQVFNPTSFNYNQELCYRDTGLIVDAVSQDILLGGNQKSLEAGLSYWNQAYNYVAGQVTTTTAAINYARDISLQIIANQPVTAVTGTVATQVINPFFQYGGDYMPQQAVRRNFDIVSNIITNGPKSAPPVYAGGGLVSLTGLNGSEVIIAPTVTSVDKITTGTYRIGLSTNTIGFGNNATLYFGDVLIFPLQDYQVEEKSLAYTGNATTWNQRKTDKIGSMGGSLVDGGVISDRSPIQSFVYDAYTQVTQGGVGIKVTNNGYAQLVSVFTLFCSNGVLCDNGGIASIVNSNANFGDLCLVAKGFGRRDFSGTVFNPPFRAYPFSPQGVDSRGNPLPYLDQFYPTGYWPTGGKVEVFVPDLNNRPHIGQVMEIIPPVGHINEQGLPGFLNAQPSTGTLTTGTIVLNNIATADVYINNSVRIRDQYGYEYDQFPYIVDGFGNIIYDEFNQPTPNAGYMKWYAATGTVVTDVGYNSITLNQALTHGGGDVTNPTFFTLYFCGNSYYTVQTSVVGSSPYAPNTNILTTNTNSFYQGPSIGQIAAHAQTIGYLKDKVDEVIANIAVTTSSGNLVTQFIPGNITGGSAARPFIDLRFDQMINIINAPDINSAKAVVPPSLITTSGTIPTGAGAAITLIEGNIDFLAAEVASYVGIYLGSVTGATDYNSDKCARDVKLILQQIIYDLESGGNYNSVYSGLSYWSRPGTYHVVELGEAVTRPDLFPDGSTVNFYQRSYISASGYVFEYVGAGTDYGALPQRGVADPVQSKETVQLNSGKVFFTSTDQNGDFRIGPGLVISQATGVLSGRTFVQSLYANMTPFILAIE